MICLGLIFSGYPALAQNAPNSDREPTAQTRIVTDNATGTVSILVDGREIVRIDADGLHVNGDIDYSGAITDGNRYSRELRSEKGAR